MVALNRPVQSACRGSGGVGEEGQLGVADVQRCYAPMVVPFSVYCGRHSA